MITGRSTAVKMAQNFVQKGPVCRRTYAEHKVTRTVTAAYTQIFVYFQSSFSIIFFIIGFSSDSIGPFQKHLLL